MEIMKLFGGVYENKRVFVTGHTGFKGSWLVLWLMNIGAIVKGYSLNPITNPSHWELLNMDVESIISDIRDREKLENEIRNFSPDIVFHLAAQPLVRYSYLHPVETYDVNVIGTLNVLEACRKAKDVKAIVNITSDKCYDNRESERGYNEDDKMGGFDPYSSSKGCSELLTSSFRNSFFNLKDYGRIHNTLLASVRAGNVIGGGDWAEDRLVPDIIKATVDNKPVNIRNPFAIRPWQHVLDPLSGYLMLGQKLLEGNSEYASGWNFGPAENDTFTVSEVLKNLKSNWDKISINIEAHSEHKHEARLLKLNCSKANDKLGWFPTLSKDDIFLMTISWYKDFYNNNSVNTFSDLNKYIKIANRKNMNWIK